MVYKFNRDNSPNAGILASSLRFLGYTNSSAIADLMDNSFDAEANEIILDIFEEEENVVEEKAVEETEVTDKDKSKSKSKKIVINIFDDGNGMTESILDQALRLGSDTSHDINNELGKFGMGLSTASTSLARRVTVITKKKNSDEILSSTQDIDEIIKANAFVKTLGAASQEEADELKRYLIACESDSDSGTLIKLVDCDGLTNKNIKQFTSTLIYESSRIFRDFLNSDKKITINSKKVNATDIFMLDEGGEVYSDEEYEVSFTYNNEEIKEKVRVRLGILPNYGLDLNKKKKINQRTQGFSVLRNNREICFGETLKLYTRHNQMNRFRGEISISGILDEACGITFQKSTVDLKQWLFDSLTEQLKPQIKAIQNKLKNERKASSSSEVTHNEAESYIKKKSALLKKPKVPNEATDETNNDGKNQGSKNGFNGSDKSTPQKGLDVQFEHSSMGKFGHIYEVRKQGHKIVIEWNIDHPFYETFVLNMQGNKELTNAVDYLIFSLASAELLIENEDKDVDGKNSNAEVIEQFKAYVSLNLNTLLR